MSPHLTKSCHNHRAVTSSWVQRYLTHETLARHATQKEGRLCTQIGLGLNTKLESCLTLGKLLHLAELWVHLLKRG